MLLNRIDKALGHVRDETVITSFEEEIKKEKTLNRKVTYYLCNRIVVFIYE